MKIRKRWSYHGVALRVALIGPLALLVNLGVVAEALAMWLGARLPRAYREEYVP